MNRGQPLSQPIVWTHNDNYRLFTFGQPASPEVRKLAEEGDNRPLYKALKSDHNVQDVVHVIRFPEDILRSALFPGLPWVPEGPFGPQTVTFTVRGNSDSTKVTVATMLGATNDAFTAVTVALPSSGSAEAFGDAYDAGTEKNTEEFADVPCGIDDRCTTVQGFQPSGHTDPDPDTEGYVFVSAGMKGLGNIPDQLLDWQNPVALVSVKRVD